METLDSSESSSGASVPYLGCYVPMKKHLNLYTLFIAILLCTATLSACSAPQNNNAVEISRFAVHPTARQNELIQSVLAANGDLTDTKHDEFWADFKGMSDVDSQLLLSHIRDVAPALQKYQKALWQSAKISLSASKPIRTKELDIAWAELQKITPDADAQAEAEANAFLEGVASKKLFKQGNAEYYVTPEIIDLTLVGIENSIQRLLHLLDKDWKQSVET